MIVREQAVENRPVDATKVQGEMHAQDKRLPRGRRQSARSKVHLPTRVCSSVLILQCPPTEPRREQLQEYEVEWPRREYWQEAVAADQPAAMQGDLGGAYLALHTLKFIC